MKTTLLILLAVLLSLVSCGDRASETVPAVTSEAKHPVTSTTNTLGELTVTLKIEGMT